MPVTVELRGAECQQVVQAGARGTAVSELQQVSLNVQGSAYQTCLEKFLGMTVRIRHFLAETLIVVAFDELYTLVLDPDVVTFRRQRPPRGMPHSAVEVDGNAVEAVYFLADSATEIPGTVNRSFPTEDEHTIAATAMNALRYRTRRWSNTIANLNRITLSPHNRSF